MKMAKPCVSLSNSGLLQENCPVLCSSKPALGKATVTLEVLWKDRDLGRVEDQARLSTINQTMLIILLHLSKAKVTLMRQTPLSLLQSSFPPPATRNKLTGTLSDLLLVNNPWKSERTLTTYLFPSGINIPNNPQQIYTGGIFPKRPHFLLVLSDMSNTRT